MVMKQPKSKLCCGRCLHEWTPKKAGTTPKTCPKCHTYLWNRPRIRDPNNQKIILGEHDTLMNLYGANIPQSEQAVLSTHGVQSAMVILEPGEHIRIKNSFKERSAFLTIEFRYTPVEVTKCEENA